MNSSEKANLWCLRRRGKKEEYRDLTSFLQRVLTVRLFFTGGGLVQWFPFQSLLCHCTHKSLQSHTEWWHLSYSEAFMVLMKVHSSRMMTVVTKIIGALPKKRPQIDILATGHMHRLVMLIIILWKYFGQHNRWGVFFA